MIFASRYDVLGPPSGCAACDGTSLIPVKQDDEAPLLRILWTLMEARAATDDGWHFVPCPNCQPNDPLVRLATGQRHAGGSQTPPERAQEPR
jgi:hypothetical protein